MIPIKEYIALLQAVAEGKTLQLSSKSDPTEWRDASQEWHEGVKQGYLSKSMAMYDWRIKIEPSVKWLNECSNDVAVAYSSESKAREVAGCGSYRRIAVKYQEVL